MRLRKRGGKAPDRPLGTARKDYDPSSEASLGPPSSRTTVIGKPQRAIGHQGELTQGPAVCQTDRRRPLRRGPIGFPTGWPL